jgi:hypothetical protein
MEITLIIIISLLIILFTLDIIRDSQRKKWYKNGYIDAYNRFDDYYVDDIHSEASESFDEKHGFHYE